MGTCADKAAEERAATATSPTSPAPYEFVVEENVAEPSSARKTEFGVFLERSGDTPLGLDVDVLDGKTGWVLAIRNGLVSRYNDGANEDVQLKMGDFITEVNGKRDNSQDMLKALTEPGELALKVRRPFTFTVAIAGKTKTLGFDFVINPAGRAILVESISEGCIAEWNRENRDHEVRPMDRIFAVDGEKDNGQGLFERIKLSSGDVELSFVRPGEVV